MKFRFEKKDYPQIIHTYINTKNWLYKNITYH